MLRLLEPTRPATGSSVSIVRQINQNPVCFALWDLADLPGQQKQHHGHLGKLRRLERKAAPVQPALRSVDLLSEEQDGGGQRAAESRQAAGARRDETAGSRRVDARYMARKAECRGKELLLKIIGRVVETYSAIIFTGTKKAPRVPIPPESEPVPRERYLSFRSVSVLPSCMASTVVFISAYVCIFRIITVLSRIP